MKIGFLNILLEKQKILGKTKAKGFNSPYCLNNFF